MSRTFDPFILDEAADWDNVPEMQFAPDANDIG
jgi:hypothetical protein